MSYSGTTSPSDQTIRSSARMAWRRCRRQRAVTQQVSVFVVTSATQPPPDEWRRRYTNGTVSDRANRVEHRFMSDSDGLASFAKGILSCFLSGAMVPRTVRQGAQSFSSQRAGVPSSACGQRKQTDDLLGSAWRLGEFSRQHLQCEQSRRFITAGK